MDSQILPDRTDPFPGLGERVLVNTLGGGPLTFFGLDIASGPDVTVRWWCTGDGGMWIVPDYIPTHWLDRITLEWGPDRDGNMRWHYLWTGWNNGEGHAKVRHQGKAIYCHRDIVERVEGRKLSRWNYVDHRCERKNCLNYDCLEAVPPGENTRRGPGAHQQFKPADAYVEPERSPATYGEPLDGL